MIDMQKIESRFPQVVGQTAAKKQLSLFLDGYDQTEIMPSIFLISAHGGGKTTMARAIGRNLLGSDGKPKPFFEINASTIKSAGQFFESFYMKKMLDKEATVFIDEAGELPDCLRNALLTLLNREQGHCNSLAWGEHTIEFDFKKHSFIFATTEAQKVFKPLMARFERIELESYTNEQLAKIVVRNLPDGAQIDSDTLCEIVSVLKGNPREAQKMGEKIKTYLIAKQKDAFNNADWEEFRDIMGIVLLGLSPIELQVLRILSTRNGTSLTQLSARTGINPEALRTDIELNLMRLGFLEVKPACGRVLTLEGHDYLKKLDAQKTPVTVAP